MSCVLALGALLPTALQDAAAASSSSSAAPRSGNAAPADGGVCTGSSGSNKGSSSSTSTSTSSGGDIHTLDSSQEQPQQPQPPQQPQQPDTGLALGSGDGSMQPPRLLHQHEPTPAATAAVAAAAAPPGPAAASASAATATADVGLLFPPAERTQVRNSWDSLMRWSRYFRCVGVAEQLTLCSSLQSRLHVWADCHAGHPPHLFLAAACCRSREESDGALAKLEKVVVFGGGSFGTAMGVSLARQRTNVQAS